MIQITAYLRSEEALSKWKALPNKAEWLHEHLNTSAGHQAVLESSSRVEQVPVKNKVAGSTPASPAIAQTIKDIVVPISTYTELDKRQQEKSIAFCKNGHPIPAGRSKCLGKGCKLS